MQCQLICMESSKLFPIRKTPGTPVWQRNYYEHIIRDQKAFQNIELHLLETTEMGQGPVYTD